MCMTGRSPDLRRLVERMALAKPIDQDESGDDMHVAEAMGPLRAWSRREKRRRSIRNSSLRLRGKCRIGDRAAQKIERLLERAVILFVRWHIGLRAGLFGAFRLEVAAQRRLALGASPHLQIVRHFL